MGETQVGYRFPTDDQKLDNKELFFKYKLFTFTFCQVQNLPLMVTESSHDISFLKMKAPSLDH